MTLAYNNSTGGLLKNADGSLMEGCCCNRCQCQPASSHPVTFHYCGGARPFSELITDSGHNPASAVCVQLFECGANGNNCNGLFNFPGGVMTCPGGIYAPLAGSFAYCYGNANDGAGHCVYFGVCEGSTPP